MDHEILFGRNPQILDGTIHLDYTEPLLNDVPVTLTGTFGGHDFLFSANGMNELEIPTGGQLTLDFTLPDAKVGNWEVGCFEFLSMDNTDEHPGPTHYDVGMHLPIVVRPASHA